MIYNGWKNYQTWNIALWILNDEGLYELSRHHKSYQSFCDELREIGVIETHDNVAFNDSGLDIAELDSLFLEEEE